MGCSFQTNINRKWLSVCWIRTHLGLESMWRLQLAEGNHTHQCPFLACFHQKIAWQPWGSSLCHWDVDLYRWVVGLGSVYTLSSYLPIRWYEDRVNETMMCRTRMFEGSLEVKLPTIWTDEKQSREEAERRERLEERRVEEKESEERRCRCEKR